MDFKLTAKRRFAKSCAYPQCVIRRYYRGMKKRINLDSDEFQKVLAGICKEKNVDVSYVNKNAHIVATGHSSLPITEQRIIANCMRMAMCEIDKIGEDDNV